MARRAGSQEGFSGGGNKSCHLEGLQLPSSHPANASSAPQHPAYCGRDDEGHEARMPMGARDFCRLQRGWAALGKQPRLGFCWGRSRNVLEYV